MAKFASVPRVPASRGSLIGQIAAAAPAPAEHGEVPDVDREAALRGQPAYDVVDDRALHLLHAAAVAADQVEVVDVLRRGVRRRTVAEVKRPSRNAMSTTSLS